MEQTSKIQAESKSQRGSKDYTGCKGLTEIKIENKSDKKQVRKTARQKAR